MKFRTYLDGAVFGIGLLMFNIGLVAALGHAGLLMGFGLDVMVFSVTSPPDQARDIKPSAIETTGRGTLGLD